MNREFESKLWIPTEDFMNKEREFIATTAIEMGEGSIRELIETAQTYRERAYEPYSHYKVGAALLTIDGKVYGGCNSEGVNYSTSNHAEGSVIAKANTEDEANRNRKYIKALAVVHEGDSGPCGECLQRIVEHCDNCLIIVAKPNGEIRRITSLKAIFPYNFNPSHLGL